MKIVIDIPDFKWLENEGDFKEAVKEYEQGTRFDKEIRNALLNGTPLLEQQPCEDCISREDALDCLTASGLKKFDFILDARDKIKNLPSVTPTITDVENNYNIGYNCGYADAMIDIAEGE